MILLQIIVAASLMRSHGRRKSVEPMRIESDGKPEDIPITDEEVRLLAKHLPELVKDVLRQEEDKE